jgi:hypothetical protein
MPNDICALLTAAAGAAAGDGPGQHPTQALLDVYSIKKEIGRLNVSWQCTFVSVDVFRLCCGTAVLWRPSMLSRRCMTFTASRKKLAA